jgi:hypothetical protein
MEKIEFIILLEELSATESEIREIRKLLDTPLEKPGNLYYSRTHRGMATPYFMWLLQKNSVTHVKPLQIGVYTYRRVCYGDFPINDNWIANIAGIHSASVLADTKIGCVILSCPISKKLVEDYKHLISISIYRRIGLYVS